MKRTLSLTLLSDHPLLGGNNELFTTPLLNPAAQNPCVAGEVTHFPVPSVPEDDSGAGPSYGDQFDPWAYGAEPGVEAWRPPPTCQTHDASLLACLRKCSFCHRSLDQFDIFMYRGDKAFCSLQCRQHQILLDDRHLMFKQEGKRYSMVPCLELAEPPQGVSALFRCAHKTDTSPLADHLFGRA